MKPSRVGTGRGGFGVEASLLGAPAGFLGRFDEDALRAELQAEGILAGLHARGYPEVTLELARQEGEHQLRVLPRDGALALVELRLEERTTVVEEEVLRAAGLEVLSVLSNNWLALQDPRGHFRPERPPLPGQTYPGLGLSRTFFTLLFRWAREWGKDAVLAIPEYFHNAVFYSPAFRFLSAREQGRFEALRRDLEPLGVAGASRAVEAGEVIDQATAEAIEWRPGPMAAPVGAHLRAALEGDRHRRSAEEARDAVRFIHTPR